jgi:hypothetical protein
VPLKLMHVCRVVLKIPAKISVAPGLPLNKSRRLPTHSESTLPQPLIPLHFISFSCNVYKKTGEGPARPSPKVLQFVTTCSPVLRAGTNVRNPNPLTHLLHKSRTPRGWGPRCFSVGQPILAVFSPSVPRSTTLGARITATRHAPTGPQVPLRRNRQSARITPVAQGGILGRKHIRSARCLTY